MRSALIFAVAVATLGCSRQPEPENARAFIAVGGYYCLMEPQKAPDEKPGVCPECRGTGRVGDGVVFSTCKVCNGTGKTTVSVLIGGPTCKDGKCDMRR
jgi:hypothetical protein